MKSRVPSFALIVLLAAGCQDLGLPENTPEDEARVRPPSELVAAVTTHGDQPSLIADGHEWVVTGPPTTLDAATLRPVGSSHGRTVYARTWDAAPHDELFVRVQPEGDPAGEPADARGEAGGDAGTSRWQRYVPVLGAGGAGDPSDGGH